MTSRILWLVGLYAVLSTGSFAAERIFQERADFHGLSFIHFNGMTGKHYFPEMTGQGGALFDYDGDGDLDVYLVQGAMLSSAEALADALFPPQDPTFIADRLFRNDLERVDGRVRPRFVDVTRTSGLAATGYGMGAVAGDYDGDGWTDLYVTNYGANQLWRNRGDGTFEDATAEAGVGDGLWGTSASFFDYDGDGWLDLYVANYVEFDVEANPRCFAVSSREDYCGPDAFSPQPDRLWRNQGDGTFEDVTSRVLPGYAPGPGLGVASGDLNGDGAVDLYVANDGKANQLWINQDNGTFADEALFSGAAVNREGRAEASMGVDLADYDGDGDEDIFLTHLMGETNTLYVNDGTGFFDDRSLESGLGAMSFPLTSFGTAWLDYDNDGWLDLLIASGAVRILEEQAAGGDPYPLKQSNKLLRNDAGRFTDASADAGEVFELLEVSRGIAVGDVENDGDADAVIFNSNGPVRLLENQHGSQNSWVAVAVVSSASSATAGARVRVETDGGRTLWRRSRTDGSYCSSRDPRVLVGLADGGQPISLSISFAGGNRKEFRRMPLGRYVVVGDVRWIAAKAEDHGTERQP